MTPAPHREMSVILRRDRRTGSAAMEHALILAVIVGGVLLAVRPLADRMSQTMHVSALTDHSLPASSAKANPGSTGIVEPGSSFIDRSYNALGVTWILLGSGFLVWRYGERRRRQKSKRTSAPRRPVDRITASRLIEKRQQIYQRLSVDLMDLLHSRLTVGHLMTETLLRIPPETTRESVLKLMESEHVHHVLVCDGKGILVGVVSDRDFKKAEALTAGTLMTSNPLVVRVNDPVELAIHVMIQRHVSCLPVVDGPGIAVGVLTSSDLLLTLQCALHLLERTSAQVTGSPLETVPG